MNEQLLKMSANVELRAADNLQKPAKVSILGYNGGLVTIEGSTYVHDIEGIEIPEVIPILADHKNDLNSVLGSGKAFV